MGLFKRLLERRTIPSITWKHTRLRHLFSFRRIPSWFVESFILTCALHQPESSLAQVIILRFPVDSSYSSAFAFSVHFLQTVDFKFDSGRLLSQLCFTHRDSVTSMINMDGQWQTYFSRSIVTSKGHLGFHQYILLNPSNLRHRSGSVFHCYSRIPAIRWSCFKVLVGFWITEVHLNVCWCRKFVDGYLRLQGILNSEWHWCLDACGSTRTYVSRPFCNSSCRYFVPFIFFSFQTFSNTCWRLSNLVCWALEPGSKWPWRLSSSSHNSIQLLQIVSRA